MLSGTPIAPPEVTKALIKHTEDTASAIAHPGQGEIEHPEWGPLNFSGMGLSVPQSAAMAGVMAVTRDPTEIIHALKERVPDLKSGQDKQGNWWVQGSSGDPMYVTRPGWDDPGKAIYYGTQAIPSIFTGGRTAGYGFFPRTAGQMGGASAQSVVSDVIGKMLGTGGGIDLGRARDAAIGTAALNLGGAGVAMAGRIVGNLWGRLFGGAGDVWAGGSAPPPNTPVTRGMLNDTGKVLFDQGNLQDGQLTAADFATAKTLARGQESTPGVANTATSKVIMDKGGFTGEAAPTLGQVTGDSRQLLTEERIARSGDSDMQDALKTRYGAQAGQVQGNKTGLIAEATGDAQRPGFNAATYDPSEAARGEDLLTAIRTHAGNLDDTATKAWAQVPGMSTSGQSGIAATFTHPVADGLDGRLAEIADGTALGAPIGKDPYSPVWSDATTRNFPKAAKAYESAINLITESQPDGSRALTPFNVGKWNQVRDDIGALYGNARDPQDKAIVGRIFAAVDQAGTDGFTAGNVAGDAGVFPALRTAIAASRAKLDFTRPLNNPDAASFIDDALNTKGYSGQQAINDLFGSERTVTGGGGTLANIEHLQSNLPGGDTGPGMRAVDGALISRMTIGPKGATDTAWGTGEKSGIPTYGATEKTINMQLGSGAGKEVADKLLSPGQQMDLSGLASQLQILNHAYERSGPRLNTSGTAAALQNPTSGLLGLANKLDIPVVSPTLRSWQNSIDLDRALNTDQPVTLSTGGWPPPPRNPPSNFVTPPAGTQTAPLPSGPTTPTQQALIALLRGGRPAPQPLQVRPFSREDIPSTLWPSRAGRLGGLIYENRER